ncbi:MAG: 2-phosphosulfolactate phosphatase [Bacteroidota bacterium]
MKVDLVFTPGQVDEMSLRGKTVVMIDVLRSSTTIVTALRNGAKEVIPVATVESAVKISGNLFGDVILLGGERNGRMIEGFHLGNSPAEYTEEKVKGKSIIFSSTNGSQAMVRARHAQELLVCGFVNISAVAEHLREGSQACTIVCAGRSGAFSLEDAVCGGFLIHKLAMEGDHAELSDAAMGAHALYKSFGRSILKMIRGSEHGRHLAEIGFAGDLPLCAEVDTIPLVPCLAGNVIRRKRNPDPAEHAPARPVPSRGR